MRTIQRTLQFLIQVRFNVLMAIAAQTKEANTQLLQLKKVILICLQVIHRGLLEAILEID